VRVAVSSSGRSLDSQVDPRFGRCPFYIIVDIDTLDHEVVNNANINAPSGAGIGAAQVVVGRGIDAVLTGSVGPNANQVLSQAGVKIITGVQGSVRQAVEAFKKGDLKVTQQASYGGYGVGMGRGMGRGMGLGRGMGRGVGSAYSYQTQQPYIEPSAMGSEKDMLKERLELLEEELKKIKKRLEELKE
jgi:predicted Fe-Mo cluster-binding NifX family protein